MYGVGLISNKTDEQIDENYLSSPELFILLWFERIGIFVVHHREVEVSTPDKRQTFVLF